MLPGSSSSTLSMSSDGFHGLHSSILRIGIFGNHSLAFRFSFSSLMIVSSCWGLIPAIRGEQGARAYDFREDACEAHEVVLVHVAMEKITMWWRFVDPRQRPYVFWVERGSVWVKDTMSVAHRSVPCIVDDLHDTHRLCFLNLCSESFKP